ncbi:hypothetical protein J8273_5776 [Carpediemonas membranifera]|uniref:Uncharacterized protein n=1 Tax=Carpediemonas membranifera TaxID=201153 RepID=A0A8J6E106_9EUKA|nr:hypothetical protein J8273_5776 [Carpediemonas membranifera]|eukprot:KAG9392843.1 hypothetical protein J8273_5776 [Carpediemonas membranifera]
MSRAFDAGSDSNIALGSDGLPLDGFSFLKLAQQSATTSICSSSKPKNTVQTAKTAYTLPDKFFSHMDVVRTPYVPSSSYRAALTAHAATLHRQLAPVIAEPIPLMAHRDGPKWLAVCGLGKSTRSALAPTPQAVAGLRPGDLSFAVTTVTAAVVEWVEAGRPIPRVTVEWLLALLLLLEPPLAVGTQVALFRLMKAIAFVQAHAVPGPDLAAYTALLVLIADTHGQRDLDLFRPMDG